MLLPGICTSNLCVCVSAVDMSNIFFHVFWFIFNLPWWCLLESFTLYCLLFNVLIKVFQKTGLYSPFLPFILLLKYFPPINS